jgi:transposase
VGANPVDRGKPGSKLHLVCDGGGLPLTAAVTAANVNDTTLFQPLLDDVPSVQGPSGRRRCRPAKVHGDKGYDSTANRAYLRRRRIKSRIARRGIESSSRLGRHRWRVERSLSWLSCFRRLGCAGTGTQDAGLRSCCWPVQPFASPGCQPRRNQSGPRSGPGRIRAGGPRTGRDHGRLPGRSPGR